MLNGTWSNWAQTSNQDFASNTYGFASYSLNPTDGTFTVSGNVDYHSIAYSKKTYYGPLRTNIGITSSNVGNTLTRYRYYGDPDKFHKPDAEYQTMTSVLKEFKSVGNFEEEIIAKAGTYEDESYVGEKYYKLKEQARPYYLYKYIDKEIKTTYDVENKIIYTKKINLGNGKENVKILVNSNDSNYKLSISNDNSNWNQIEDNAILNGEVNIPLSEQWKEIYIKIERNNSNIHEVIVR